MVQRIIDGFQQGGGEPFGAYQGKGDSRIVQALDASVREALALPGRAIGAQAGAVAGGLEKTGAVTPTTADKAQREVGKATEAVLIMLGMGSKPKARAAEKPVEVAKPETVSEAAINLNGKIYTGTNHLAAVEKAAAAEGLTTEQFFAKYSQAENPILDDAAQGFVTSTGRYVDRVEAHKLANKTGQLDEAANLGGHTGLDRELRETQLAAEGLKNPAEAAKPETIRSAAVRTDDGNVYEGPNHIQAIDAAAAKRGVRDMDIHSMANEGKLTDGFITSEGRFVDRAEADRIATAQNQKDPNFNGRKASEGLGASELKPETVSSTVPPQIAEMGTQSAAPEAPPAAPKVEPPPAEMNAARKAARVVQNILSPDTVSPLAEKAAGDIRSAGGRAARDTETTRTLLDSERRKVAAMDEPQRLGFIDYIENKSKSAELGDPTLQPLADTLRTEMEKRRAKLEELNADQAFVDDYFPHMWENPEGARTFAEDRGIHATKQGSGASLKARTIPTIAEGIEAGLKPVTTDPIETVIRYVNSMDRFIASQEVLKAAEQDHTIIRVKPKVMGASGNPEGSVKVPPGYVAINGRGANNASGVAYAPADWARVYNNFIDPGFHRNADVGKVYDAVRNTSNAVTSLELGLSGFHAATMAQEAMVNGVARAISEMASGRPIKSAQALAKAVSPRILKGREIEHVYTGQKEGSPLTRQITDLLTEAGGRGKGARHAPDYQYTAMGSYWDTFKHGNALLEAKAFGRAMKDQPLKTTAMLPFRTVGRVMQTVAKPLFEYTIPKMKNAAFYDNMASWLENNPAADHAAQVKAARKIWDSIDNRFGETVQDNIFWNKALKQSLQVALRSYSWTSGTIQEIGGGAKDLIRHPTSISMKSKHYSPKASYVIALPIVYATLNAVYQKLKTGQDPESVDDVMRGGLTGGTQPGVGGRGQVPERVMMPGYMKDVFGWYHHPVQEATNKMATAPRMVLESLKNKDWKDQPIRNPNDPATDQVRQYLQYVYQSLGPISVRQLAKGNKAGSNIGPGEQMLGFRPAPSFLQDPKGYERSMKGVRDRDWKRKRSYDLRQERQYGGQ